ncbi:translation initiation factor eIF4e [Hypoxylon sp. FL0890]|nr:translation initiation factor eIF4e [Hypoxylon sp. FL0890]
MDRQESIWTRRNNLSNLSLSTPSQPDNNSSTTPRDFSSLARRNGPSSSHGRSNPFSATTPGSTLTSPTSAGGANQFGLGSGAFASFGSAKTPKSQGNPFEQAMGAVGAKTPSSEKTAKEPMRSAVGKLSMSSISETSTQQGSTPAAHPLRDTWVFWYRPPITKANGYIEYDKTLHAMMAVKTVEEFWLAYSHLKRPSSLPTVSDYHLFKKGIRPIWEDDENKLGGKWVLRLKKGIADRYYEDLLMACVGDQFGDEADEVCGVVLSMRNGEDVLSIWTRSTGQKVLKIRETMRRVLNCPPETRIEFKSHDASMQQRSAIDEMRREKAAQNHDKRTRNDNKTKQSQDEQRP